MHTWKKLAAAAAVVIVSAGTGAAVARQASGPGDPGTGATASSARTVKDLGNGTTETKYIALTPCRIVDTRLAGGQIASNVSRSFHARGTSGFVPQGGKSGGCGVPTSATAIEVAVTSVDSTGDGYMRIYPVGTSEPTATFINYSPNNPTNTGAVTLCKTGCGAGDVTVKGHGSNTQVVMDVQGYFAKPMGALIDTDGSVTAGSRVTGVRHPSAGVYYVSFDRALNGCVAVASPWYNPYDITAVQVVDDSGTPSTALTVLVVIEQRSDSAGVNSTFSLEVMC
jgi:hypothetical protein